jgi:arsenate reductase
MAEGWLRYYAADRAEILSAGVEAHGLNPRAVEVMREAGVDISHHTSKTVEDLGSREFDVVITVCDNARERCPWFPARVLQLHQDFQDPAKAAGTDDEILEVFRTVREQIRRYSQAFVITHLRQN